MLDGNKYYISACFALLSTSLFGQPTVVRVNQSQPQLFSLSSINPLFNIAGGILNIEQIKSQALPIFNEGFYKYKNNSSNKSLGIAGGFIGGEIIVNPKLSLQLGLSYYQPSPYKVSGILTQGIANCDAEIDSFNYNYRVLPRQFLVESKLLYTLQNKYHPYAIFGLGGASNKAYSYQVNFPGFLTFSPIFTDKTTATFSYSIGIGIDVDIMSHFRAGIGYRFVDFGRVGFGLATIDTTPMPSTLNQTHLYANAALAQLTYLM